MIASPSQFSDFIELLVAPVIDWGREDGWLLHCAGILAAMKQRMSRGGCSGLSEWTRMVISVNCNCRR